MKENWTKKILAGITAFFVLLGGTPAGATEGDAATEKDVAVEKQTVVENEAADAGIKEEPQKTEKAKAADETPIPEKATQEPAQTSSKTETAAPTVAPAEETVAPAEETHAPVEETRAPVQETRAPAPTATPAVLFTPGYASVRTKTVFYGEDDEERTLDGAAVVYAYAYDEKKERVHVAFNENARIQKAWVDVSSLRMLDAKAIETYLEGDEKEALEWKYFLLWPLKFKPERSDIKEQTEVEKENGTTEGADAPEQRPADEIGAEKNVNGSEMANNSADLHNEPLDAGAVPGQLNGDESESGMEEVSIPDAAAEAERANAEGTDAGAAAEADEKDGDSGSAKQNETDGSAAVAGEEKIPETFMGVAVDAPSDGAESPDGTETLDGGAVPEGSVTPDDTDTPDGGEVPDGEETPDGGGIPDGTETPDGSEIPDGEAVPDGEEMPDGEEIPEGEETPGDAEDAQGAFPALSLDLLNERLIVAAPETAGTLRFFFAETGEIAYTLEFSQACEVALKDLCAMCGAEEIVLRAEFSAEGMESVEAELRIPARAEYIPDADVPQIAARYTTATIAGSGQNEYALSLPDETEPGLFCVEGMVSGLKGGTRYAVWARTPATQEQFASEWVKLEGVEFETLPQTEAEASFNENGTTQLQVEWRPGMAPLDLLKSLSFRCEGASIDEAVAGNLCAQWRNEAGELLETAPVDAGVYTMELTFTGEAEKYALREPGLKYIIDPIDLSTASFALFEGKRCVYNAEVQYPINMRVVLGEYTIPETCYELKENGSANRINAGEACALIVGANGNVVGQRAFAYRIDPRPVTVIPERPADVLYSGSTAISLTREGWALDGVIDGDVLTLDLDSATAEVDTPDAGEGREVHFEGVVLSGEDASNYVIGEIETATVNILRAAAPKIEWPTEATITYGQRLSEAVLAAQDADLGSFAWTDGEAMPNAGDALFEAQFVPADAENYDWSQQSLRAEIAVKVQPRAATIFAGSFEKYSGEADPSFTASTEGVLKGDTLSYTLSREKGEALGSYAIYVKPGKNPNYSIKTKNGMLTIRGKSINASSVTVMEIPRQVYTGSAIEPKPVVRDGATLLQRDVDYRLEYHGNRLEGVATIDIIGIGKYNGTRTVSFTIYKLSSIGGISNDYGVEGETGAAYSFTATDPGAGWESGDYTFLAQSQLLNNPLYDEYLGTGAGLDELNIVRSFGGAAQAYELLPIYAQMEEGGVDNDVDGTLLVYAGPDESGEATDAVFSFSGRQLARLYVERGMHTLLLRNCETTISLDIYELLSGDIARIVDLMDMGAITGVEALDALETGATEDALTTQQLGTLRYEVRTEILEMENGDTGYGIGVYLCVNGAEMEVSSMFTSMSVGANVEGMFDEGEEEQSIASFLESYANARMNDFGEPERLEGELVVLPDALPEWQEDVASLYRVSFDGDVPEAAVQEETNVPLDSYRCQTLLSAWAGSGLYTLHDGGAES